MSKQVDTLVIGGGQAGLAISYYLSRQGREHIILEQNHRVAEAWRSRWDSFTLDTPNWKIRLPGFPYRGDDPDGFMSRDEVVAFFEQYVAFSGPPLQFGRRVLSLEQNPGETSYLAKTDDVAFEAANVVVSTGTYQRPQVPSFSGHLAQEILQMHTSEYRNAQALPAGAVLVVGSGQSGFQIAAELHEAGRAVYLSVGRSGAGPRRFRGKDLSWWITRLPITNLTVDQLSSPSDRFGSAHITGIAEGRTLDLHHYARDGMVLLGRLQQVQGSQVLLAADLGENLAKADKFTADFKQAVDEYVQQTRLDAPQESLSSAPKPAEDYATEQITELDLDAAGIHTVIWATGYTWDFTWVRLPVFDRDGYPIQRRGITAYPGLYFLGLIWQHSFHSHLIHGVGDDAAFLAEEIAARAGQAQGRPKPGLARLL